MPYRFHHDRAERRFWARVLKTDDGCWLWTGCVQSEGYGNLSFGGRYWRAHRLAWVLTGHDLPDDHDLCHHCDNPRCVNPAHLFVGTRLDNMQDAVRKGRMSHGARRWSAKLTAADVAAIRAEAPGATLAALSAKWGVCKQQIHRIIRRQNWRAA